MASDKPENYTLNYKMLRTGNNVIDMRLDAAYFFERGVHFLERNHLSKALRAFERTIEYEPENPVNHFNLAGVLSEMGDFEASNKVLLHVLNDLDPSMAECQFYLANNYANMGEYEAAEEHVLRYLDSDPDGEYAPDAEEMLALLVDEFGGGKAYERWRESQAEKERTAAHRDGRHLLEAGHFEAAVEYLEDIVKGQPDNLAAMNNLSLAYYYTAMHDEAIATTERVLEIQPDNIHALCNLTVYSIHQGPRTRLYECVDKLRRIFPLHYDQAMKVGTTLGLVGDHETALQIFTVLAKLVEIPDAALMHSIAAAAANTGRFPTARKWWKQLRQLPDMESVADYHLQRLDSAVSTKANSLRVSYQYDLPIENQFAQMKRRLNSAKPSEWQDDPVLRASMYWGLRHGNSETRRAVIRTLAIIGDEDAQKALRLFVRRTDISEPIRQVALSALKICDPNGIVEFYDGTEVVRQPLDNLPWEMLLQMDSQWNAIWQQAQSMLHEKNCADCHLPAKTAWLGFLKRLFIRNDVRVIKPEVWVAGLVYLATKGAGQKTSQKEVAESLGVSVSSLRKASRRLQTYFPLNK